MKPLKYRVLKSFLISMSHLILCLVMVPFFAHASELSEQEIRSAVQTWVRHVTADARPDAVIEKMEPYTVEGMTVGYVAHLSGGGFCLAGADDLVLPVYFYSTKGIYDPQNPNYQYILGEINDRTKYLRKSSREKTLMFQKYHEALTERASFWQDLIAGRAPERIVSQEAVKTAAEPDEMTLNLTSHWEQRSPYNDQCPELSPAGTGDHTLVGCVATATGQVMYYWKWPNTGVGNHQHVHGYSSRWRTDWAESPLKNNPDTSIFPGIWRGRLEWTSANGGRLRMTGSWDYSIYLSARRINNDPAYRNALQALREDSGFTIVTTQHSADFGTTTYNLSLLRDEHTVPVDPGDAEVAKLSYHLGIALGPWWGVDGTSASIFASASALPDYFRYDQDTVHEARDANT
ncbi:MAG: hypothetical protein GY941_28430 [Planctomycetes bacterium]|nr:hypothetical protein [Planctomycetota bacterium]